MSSRRRSTRLIMHHQESLKGAGGVTRQSSNASPPPGNDDDGGSNSVSIDGNNGSQKESIHEEALSDSPIPGAASGKGGDRGRKRLRKGMSATAGRGGKVTDLGGGDSDLSDGLGDPDFGERNGDDKASDIQSKSAGRVDAKGIKRKTLTKRDDKDADSDASDTDLALDRNRSETTVNSKSSASTTIPKKSIPRRQTDPTQSVSSLLDNLKPAPSQSIEPPPSHPPSKRPHPNIKTSTTFERHPKPTTKLSPSRGVSPKRDQSKNVDVLPAAAFLNSQSYNANYGQSVSHHPVGLSRTKQRVMTDLEQVCGEVSQDVRFSLPPSTSIDLSGSFLQDDKYDFFDTNDRGEIVLQPKVPIFPEEFPPGVTEHSLSWWGILDPDLGDGKYKQPSPPALEPPPINYATSHPSQGASEYIDPRRQPAGRNFHAPPSQPMFPSMSSYGGSRQGGPPWRGGGGGPPPNRQPPRFSPPRHAERR